MFSKLFNKLTSRVWGTQFPYRDQTKKKPKPRRKKPRNPNQTKKKNKPDWTQVVTVKVPEGGDDDEAPNEAPSFSSLSLWVWWCFVDSRKLSLEDSSSIELNFITLDWAQQNWFHCARNVSLLNYFENVRTNEIVCILVLFWKKSQEVFLKIKQRKCVFDIDYFCQLIFTRCKCSFHPYILRLFLFWSLHFYFTTFSS